MSAPPNPPTPILAESVSHDLDHIRFNARIKGRFPEPMGHMYNRPIPAMPTLDDLLPFVYQLGGGDHGQALARGTRGDLHRWQTARKLAPGQLPRQDRTRESWPSSDVYARHLGRASEVTDLASDGDNLPSSPEDTTIKSQG